ncbi:MAG: Nicotinamidase-like protein [Candidatus Methanohalarchaeum thermophilum]|uniref:Nicotinamidase-like protein n=1 Tax=Methanohalarchaeum thermophilum TaxID=1903181 RepID=A0A1Q6DWK7_METT1|nr:MAG: Nicotinamidase-like protein [Candidatus Methanohalarchaeum thermophilum]
MAVLVIDMLKDFVEEGSPLEVPKSRDIIDDIKDLVDDKRENGDEIIYVADRHRPDDSEFEDYPSHAIKGTEGAEIIDELEPKEEDTLIEKRRFSGFFRTDLDLTLREKNVDELILTGILTDICILHTAAGARMRNYDVIVPKECVAALDKESHNFALNHIEEVLGGKVKTLKNN